MPADDARELFDVVDPVTGEPLFAEEEGGAEGRRSGGGGCSSSDDEKNKPKAKTPLRVPRGVAHADGTWHASVYVHVSRSSDGSFLLQRRSATKDVCPLLWDLACAEHVSAGETREEAAVRGLSEELGLAVGRERLGEALGRPRQAVLRIDGPKPVWDREVVTSYWLRGVERVFLEGDDVKGDDDDVEGDGDGKTVIAFDEQEVCELRWISPGDLKREVSEVPERFTPWLVDELRERAEELML